MMVDQLSKPVSIAARVRRALALPIYAVALLLDFAAGAVSRLAALVAGDDWPV